MLILVWIVTILVVCFFLAVAAGTLPVDYLAFAFVLLAILAATIGKSIARYNQRRCVGHRFRKHGKIHRTE